MYYQVKCEVYLKLKKNTTKQENVNQTNTTETKVKTKP